MPQSIAKPKRSFSRAVGWTFLFCGIVALVNSIIFASSILAFIGLGLAFWGALLIYLRQEKYVKAMLIDSTAISSIENLDKIITELKYKGKGIHLPPEYFKDPKSELVYIPKKEGAEIPLAEETSEEVFSQKTQGMFITPPGLDLTNYFENELGKKFAKADLKYLQNNLPKLFMENLEIAEDLEIEIENNTFHIKIMNSVYKDLCSKAREFSSICGSVGCPLCSSIACALTRATGNPIIIEKNNLSTDGNVIETHYRILGTIKRQTEVTSAEVSVPFKFAGRHLGYTLPDVVGLPIAAFGLAILFWVGWLTWYDITTWGKSLFLIFFGSRAGEAISAGIDMRVIYYLLIGSVLFLSGIFMFFRKRLRAHVEE